MNNQFEAELWPSSRAGSPQSDEPAAELSDLNERMNRQARIFDGLLSAISDFAYAFDREGRFLFVNQSLLDLWGMRLEDAVGKTFFELPYPKEMAEVLHRQIMQVFETGEKVTDETPYTNPAGKTGYYEYIFCPVHRPDGTVEIVAGSTRDISRRKNTEEKLRESKEHYRSLFDSIDEGFCVVKVFVGENGALDYRFLDVNPSFEKQSGLTNIKGKSMRSIAPAHEEFWFENYASIAKTGVPGRFESWASALERWFDVYAF